MSATKANPQRVYELLTAKGSCAAGCGRPCATPIDATCRDEACNAIVYQPGASPLKLTPGVGSRDAVHDALCTRVRNVRLDLVATYGLEAVMQAITATAEPYTDIQLQEIGSSDVSCWIIGIEKALKLAAEEAS